MIDFYFYNHVNINHVETKTTLKALFESRKDELSAHIGYRPNLIQEAVYNSFFVSLKWFYNNI